MNEAEAVIRCWVVELEIVVVIEHDDIVGARSYEVRAKEWRGTWRTSGRVASQAVALRLARMIARSGARVSV
jgi:hypothetical protein